MAPGEKPVGGGLVIVSFLEQGGGSNMAGSTSVNFSSQSRSEM
jgi:hypothetical protein